jgi:hypothetical protein
MQYMEDYHKKSNLVDIPFDRKSMIKVLEYFMAAKDSIALVAFDGENVHGVLLGSIEPFFFNKKYSYATDLLFFATGGGVNLWKTFVSWAEGAGVARIMMGVSSGDQRACHLLESLGMENTGGMYVLRR